MSELSIKIAHIASLLFALGGIFTLFYGDDLLFLGFIIVAVLLGISANIQEINDKIKKK